MKEEVLKKKKSVVKGIWQPTLKEVFSDSNNIILWHESEDILKKKLFPKFQLIPILRFHVMHDYVRFIAPIDYCVELSLVDETFCENCSHFILKWLQPNSFGEMCFLEESYENMQKIQISTNLESALFQNQENQGIQDALKNKTNKRTRIEENKNLLALFNVALWNEVQDL